MFYRITNHPKGESLVVDKTPKYDLGQLTLPEAISHCLNVCDFIENAKARDEHLLLADWLTELQELRQNQKRILTWQEDYDRTYRHLLELIEQKELKSDYLLLSEENRKKRDRLKEK